VRPSPGAAIGMVQTTIFYRRILHYQLLRPGRPALRHAGSFTGGARTVGLHHGNQIEDVALCAEGHVVAQFGNGEEPATVWELRIAFGK